MKIKVLFFANYKEILGVDRLDLDIEPDAKIESLCSHLASKGKAWQSVFNAETIKVAVNHELAELNQRLKEGDEIAFFPPVTGG